MSDANRLPMRALAVLIMVMLVSSACANSSPKALDTVDAVGASLIEIADTKKPRQIAQITFGVGFGTITFGSSGTWTTQTTDPEADLVVKSSIWTRPSRQTFPFEQAITWANWLWEKRCPDAEGPAVEVKVVSRYAMTASLKCGVETTITLLNGKELPALKGDRSEEDLKILWGEAREIAGGPEAGGVKLTYKSATIEAPSSSVPGECSVVMWERDWASTDARARCLSSSHGPIDLLRFSEERVANAIAEGAQQLGTKPEFVEVELISITSESFPEKERVGVEIRALASGYQPSKIFISAENW